MNDPFLSALLSADWTWRVDAACRGLSTNLFFQPDHENRSLKRGRGAAAKAVCAGCPVAEPCLDWALSVGERYGVWGGLDAPERVALRQRRKRTAALARASINIASIGTGSVDRGPIPTRAAGA